MNVLKRINDALIGGHAPVAKVFPQGLSVDSFRTESFIYSGPTRLIRLVGADHGERADTIARAVNLYDVLLGWFRSSDPAPGATGVRVTVTADTLSRLDLDAIAKAGPGPILAHRIRHTPATPDSGRAERAALERITAIIFDEMPEGGVANLARATTIAADIMDRCKALYGTASEELEAVRDELAAAGHACTGLPLDVLVDRAIDAERERRNEEVGRLEKRIAAIRRAAVDENEDA